MALPLFSFESTQRDVDSIWVNAGLECGIGIDDFVDWEEGDIIETFNTVQKNRTLEEASATMAAALEEAGKQEFPVCNFGFEQHEFI